MTKEEAIYELQNCKGLIQQDGQDYLDERDIPLLDMAIEALTDRPQGEWKHTITWQPYCSNCEYVFGEDEEFSPFWNYCPMCGAKMKGGDDE